MWKPKGVIFNKHHAQLPTFHKVNESLGRIYYSTKIDGKSHIRYFDVDENMDVVSDDKEALGPGERGTFDHAGVMPSCVVREPAGRLLMFYTGWSLRVDVPYSHAIGIAIVNEDGTLRRGTGGPVLSCNHFDRYLVNSPYVEYDQRLKEWNMLYCSGTGWIDNYPTYNICSAKSKRTAFSWSSGFSRYITHNKKDEAISRVSKDWTDLSYYYSWKTKDEPYKLARFSWNQKKSDVLVERGEWDSEMQCYPAMCKLNKQRYMLYNGNGYGETGIGVAEWAT